MNAIPYTPIPGWFDLSRLNLPRAKMKQYAELQALGAEYQATRTYQMQYNRGQYEKLQELCAKMQIDLIMNYGALEQDMQAGEESR